MSCFPCCKSDVETGLFTKSPATFSKVRKSTFKSVLGAAISVKTGSSRQKYITAEIQKHGTAINDVKVFSYEELAAATDNFNPDCLVGEGGFGCVYRGYIPSLNQAVAVKQLERKRRQGTTEFFTEIMLLSLVNHPNIVKLIGYCAEEDQRILVYEFMSNGSLESQLLDLAPDKEPLDWRTRMKIAEGAARGLEYLHDIADPPVIYRDFKTSNILLDGNFNPKLSDFGLAKLGPTGGNDHITTTVMGTYGYCSPEYALTGQLTTKSDVYSFGVVFLEIITGRRVIDNNRATEEQNLINWAQPLFKDREKFSLMADPLIKEELPVKSLFKALAVAAMCLQEEVDTRPLMGDVVTSLEHLSVPTFGEKYAKAESIRSAGHIESFRVSSSRSRADQQL